MASTSASASATVHAAPAAATSSAAPAPSTSGLPLYAPPSSLRHAQSAEAQQPFDQQDPRVYFDQQAQTWRCEAPDDGDDAVTELEWNTQRRAWMPVFDEELFRAQQQAYGADEDGVDEDNDEQRQQAGASGKRKAKKARGRDDDGDVERPNKQPRKKQLNTNVYVTGLPLDATRDEIAAVFSRYGVLYEDDAGEPRVKMYADRRTGMFKGEALITYFKEESVDLAIQMLDESALRAAEGKSDPIMHVSRAEFGNKNSGNGQKHDDDNSKESGDPEVDQSQHNRSVAEARGQVAGIQQANKPSAADRKKAQKRFARMNDKLTDWNSDSDDDSTRAAAARAQGTTAAANNSAKLRQVCLRKMFSLAELDEDPTLLLDLKEDVREECESLGKVTNVVLWDKEPEGIITVKFGDHAAAVACMQKMDGRFFGGRQIIAHLLEGKPRFRRSGKGDADDYDDDEEENADRYAQATADGHSSKDEARRRDAFGEWLEGGGEE